MNLAIYAATTPEGSTALHVINPSTGNQSTALVFSLRGKVEITSTHYLLGATVPAGMFEHGSRAYGVAYDKEYISLLIGQVLNTSKYELPSLTAAQVSPAKWHESSSDGNETYRSLPVSFEDAFFAEIYVNEKGVQAKVDCLEGEGLQPDSMLPQEALKYLEECFAGIKGDVLLHALYNHAESRLYLIDLLMLNNISLQLVSRMDRIELIRQLFPQQRYSHQVATIYHFVETGSAIEIQTGNDTNRLLEAKENGKQLLSFCIEENTAFWLIDPESALTARVLACDEQRDSGYTPPLTIYLLGLLDENGEEVAVAKATDVSDFELDSLVTMYSVLELDVSSGDPIGFLTPPWIYGENEEASQADSLYVKLS